MDRPRHTRWFTRSSARSSTKSSTRWFPVDAGSGTPELDRRLIAGEALGIDCCPVCGYHGPVAGFGPNLRESGYCPGCGSWTRIRQLASLLVEVAGEMTGHHLGTVAGLAGLLCDGSGVGMGIYNTEAHGALHNLLATSPGYTASEYFGPALRSGDTGPGGVLHEDLQELSFPDAGFDVVLSTDVFEHVADPYRAHREVHRVLRPGGHHLFTVPFHEHALLDEVRARVDSDGRVEHLAEPIYHIDPVRMDDGALVYTIFGIEMLVALARIGFEVTVHLLSDSTRGLVGPGGLVFDAHRPAPLAPDGRT